MKNKESGKPTTGWSRTLAAALTLSQLAATAQTPLDVSPDVRTTLSATTPVITLNWPAVTGIAEGVTLTRTEILATGRGSAKQFSLATNATTYADTTALSGKNYEYQFSHYYRLASGTKVQRFALLNAGTELPLVENRGRVLLLVDASVATSLQAELADYADDLTLDGWVVIRRDIARMAVAPDNLTAGAGAARTAELVAAKKVVADFYNADKVNSRAVVLIGRVPVPYSGKIMPDGHTDHQGAWPADMYYADVTGTWTDSALNWTGSTARLNNTVGDGKFDQSQAPTALELEVGRIDFAGIASGGKSEVELLRQYLVRNHAYRNNLAPFNEVRREVVVDDNFGYFGGEAFARVGWNIGTAVVGRSNAKAGDWFPPVGTAPLLFGFGCGGGGYSSASGVATSDDFSSKTNRVVFNALFGSYFGDWNMNNGLLRSALGGPADSTGLASFWVNRPFWNFSGTALGGTLGSTLRTSSDRSVHRALLGDSTLRVQHRPAVSNLRTTTTTDGLLVQWNALNLGETGYHVYRTDLDTGTTIRVTGDAVSASAPDGRPTTATEFLSSGVAAGARLSFTVKPVFKETTPGGTYYDLGLGTFIEATQPGTPIEVVSAVSRRLTRSGAVDIDLDGVRTEPRALDGKLTVVIRFNQELATATASVTGSATLVSQSRTGSELTVNLANVANLQTLGLTVDNLTSATWSEAQTVTFPIRLLQGDIDQNGVVENRDITYGALISRTYRGVPTGSTRVCDLTGDGLLTAQDLVLIVNKRGTRLN
jgi:hypothetical protein